MVWSQFAMQILTRCSDPKSPHPVGDWGPCLIDCYFGLDHISVPAKWHLVSSTALAGYKNVTVNRQTDTCTYGQTDNGPRAVTFVATGGIAECFHRYHLKADKHQQSEN